MPQTAMIEINAGPTFSPNPLQVKKETVISWRNNDAKPHWPTPKPAAGQPVVNNAWMPVQISGKLPNQPAPTSIQTVNFGDPGTYFYVDALNPGVEASIVVT